MLFYFELTAELKFSSSKANIEFVFKEVTSQSQISCKWTDTKSQFQISNCVKTSNKSKYQISCKWTDTNIQIKISNCAKITQKLLRSSDKKCVCMFLYQSTFCVLISDLSISNMLIKINYTASPWYL